MVNYLYLYVGTMNSFHMMLDLCNDTDTEMLLMVFEAMVSCVILEEPQYLASQSLQNM